MLQNIADIWVLSDDRAGNVSQALGIAEFLSAQYSYEVKKIRYNSFVKFRITSYNVCYTKLLRYKRG